MILKFLGTPLSISDAIPGAVVSNPTAQKTTSLSGFFRRFPRRRVDRKLFVCRLLLPLNCRGRSGLRGPSGGRRKP